MALLRWIGEKVVVSLTMAVLLIATAALIPVGIILAKMEQRERLSKTGKQVRGRAADIVKG
jgi:hypothetical protein